VRGFALFGARLRREPAAAVGALVADYATYAAMCGFALGLVATRAPLRAIDEALGTRLRERAIDAVARVSTG
jgi:hypothetical protein